MGVGCINFAIPFRERAGKSYEVMVLKCEVDERLEKGFKNYFNFFSSKCCGE